MSNDEEKAIMGYKKEEFIEKGITKISEKGFIHYDLEMKKCKNLNNKDFTCKIHSNSNRPLVCRDYPIFLVKDYVMFATGCPAVQNGKLKSYEEKFKKLGVKIV